jgi:hypothetical protein
VNDRHALLIGIDAYLPNRLYNDGEYPPLRGCVRDIRRVEEFLVTRLGLTAERIVKLTASRPEALAKPTRGGAPPAVQPTEPRERWPTYENMVAAFRQVTEAASPGDEVYIHYSGHGGRARTIYPEKKGINGLDEALVPVDIGDPNCRYLRDLELANFLESMVGKELRVVLVLDSCHAGGATRLNYAPRGMRVPLGRHPFDETSRPTDSLVAPRQELLASWKGEAMVPRQGPFPGWRDGAVVLRDFQASTPWLPVAEGYVLLAACCPKEFAYEGEFDGAMGGALTHWLLDALNRVEEGTTYKKLHQQIVAKVHGVLPQQTPMLLGEENWTVFGAGPELEGRNLPRAVDVFGIEPDGRILLNTGQAQGVGNKALFAIHSLDTRSGDSTARRALVEVTLAGATESWATIVEGTRCAIEPGAQAFLLDPGAAELRSAVRLVREGSAVTELEERTLEALVALVTAEKSFLRLAGETDDLADLEVVVSEHAIEIRDGKGKPVPNLSPALRPQDPAAASAAVARLVHLTKYRNLQQLDHLPPRTPLAGKLAIDLLKVPVGYDPKRLPDLQPGSMGSHTLDVVLGESILLRIQNLSSWVLNLVVLDFQPDWGITQICPGPGEGAFFPLDDRKDFPLVLQADLPAGLDEGTDLLKVFATRRTANFHWLEMPPLHRSKGSGSALSLEPPRPTEKWFGPLRSNPRRSLSLIPAAFPSEEWVTVQVEVRIRRN